MLVDSHCHLNYPDFSDLTATLEQARQQGVGLCQTISTKRSDFSEIIKIIEVNEPVYGSIGIHPHEAEAHQDLTLGELLEYAAHPKIIGIGETGLDYYYEHSPREAQQRLFRLHIDVARRSGLPIIVHTRDAEEDTVNILHEEYEKGAFSGLIHCFSGSIHLADKALEIGFYISISGIITFRKASELREAVATVPLNRLLVETDAPYLAPEPHRGKPNVPAYVRLTAKKLAEIKQIDEKQLESATTENFFRLFSKAKPVL